MKSSLSVAEEGHRRWRETTDRFVQLSFRFAPQSDAS
jgi:hypothetical protein